MPEPQEIPVKQLSLDLTNFRTVPQPDELSALNALIAISPDRFWALLEGLIKDGYLPTEILVILKSEVQKPKLIVKEGNRRVGALKLIHGIYGHDQVAIPSHIRKKIENIDSNWKKKNSKILSLVYESEERSIVDQLVTRTHGKGDLTSREDWNAVAKARHNQAVNSATEWGLTLLEKYLIHGTNITKRQANIWAGDYPVTVLHEAIRSIAPALGLTNSRQLSEKYPEVGQCDKLEEFMKKVGQGKIGFSEIRTPGFAKQFEETTEESPPPTEDPEKPSKTTHAAGATPKKPKSENEPKDDPTTSQFPTNSVKKTRRINALPPNDPRNIRRELKAINPSGKGSTKIVQLKEEAEKLDVMKTPLAFCFVLRSIFEISAKVYLQANAPGGFSDKKGNGDPKSLLEILNEAKTVLTKNNKDKAMVHSLHGASTELAKSAGILSVTSMNQLIHNPNFSISSNDIVISFMNVVPLLQEMNS